MNKLAYLEGYLNKIAEVGSIQGKDEAVMDSASTNINTKAGKPLTRGTPTDTNILENKKSPTALTGIGDSIAGPNPTNITAQAPTQATALKLKQDKLTEDVLGGTSLA